jgi:hypothetical protein
MAEQTLEVHKDLRSGFFKIGDYVEIIDQSGDGVGRVGDRGFVERVINFGSNNDVIHVQLTDGRLSGRFGYRYRKLSTEWDN